MCLFVRDERPVAVASFTLCNTMYRAELCGCSHGHCYPTGFTGTRFPKPLDRSRGFCLPPSTCLVYEAAQRKWTITKATAYCTGIDSLAVYRTWARKIHGGYVRSGNNRWNWRTYGFQREHSLRRVQRSEYPVTCPFVDLHKYITNTLSHMQYLLHFHICKLLKFTLLSDSLLCKYSGQEYSVPVPYLSRILHLCIC